MKAFLSLLVSLAKRIKEVRKRTIALAILAVVTVWSASTDVGTALEALFQLVIEHYESGPKPPDDGSTFISDDIGDRSKFLALSQ